jgi:hypothetical protein
MPSFAGTTAAEDGECADETTINWASGSIEPYATEYANECLCEFDQQDEKKGNINEAQHDEYAVGNPATSSRTNRNLINNVMSDL